MNKMRNLLTYNYHTVKHAHHPQIHVYSIKRRLHDPQSNISQIQNIFQKNKIL